METDNKNEIKTIVVNKTAFCVVTIIIGISLIIGAIYSTEVKVQKARDFEETQGVIESISFRRSNNEDRRKVYTYTCSYVVNNETYTKSGRGTGYEQKGDTIRVFYNADDPSEAHLNRISVTGGYKLVFLGSMLCIFGLMWGIRSKRSE